MPDRDRERAALYLLLAQRDQIKKLAQEKPGPKAEAWTAHLSAGLLATALLAVEGRGWSWRIAVAAVQLAYWAGRMSK